jgi:ABC-type transporter Mla subunit MlaD
VLTSIACIAVALILVIGQIALATTKGISAHLHTSVQNITDGNKVMEEVLERSAPSAALGKVLASQSTTLANTRDAMVQTNGELGQIADTTGQLGGVVDGMGSTSGQLADTIGSMETSTKRMTDQLGTLPGATERTSGSLSRINSDMAAVNVELNALAAKLQKYGLKQAAGARIPS